MKHKNIIIPGFQFAGIHCGIKDNKRKKDLALIYSEEPNTLVDGVFTMNKVFAAPVKICRSALKSGKGKGRLIVINSGIANACTGKQGEKHALQTQKEASKVFDLKLNEVFVSSTGKIAGPLPMKKLLPGIAQAKKSLSPKNFMATAQGIMTTDQYAKFASVKGKIGKQSYTMAVVAKGAGMLCPNMATMLAYVVTDLKFSSSALKTIFRRSVDKTLNRVTVDGDTSTNDTVLVMANGKAGNKTFSANAAQGKKVEKEMTGLLEKMARMIALDGEGATTCCDVYVHGASGNADAKKIAYAVGNSLLVKTALFGNDPNWGRIMAAVGYSGAKIKQEKIGIKIGPHWVAKKGVAAKFKESAVSKYMKNEKIRLDIYVGSGSGEFNIYMSDLTYDYIHLNAEYHT